MIESLLEDRYSNWDSLRHVVGLDYLRCTNWFHNIIQNCKNSSKIWNSPDFQIHVLWIMFHLVILSRPNVRIVLVFLHRGYQEKKLHPNQNQWHLQLDQNHQYWHGSCKHLISCYKIKWGAPSGFIHLNRTRSWTGRKCTITVWLAIDIISAAGLTFKQRPLTIHNAIWKVPKTPFLKMALQSRCSF